MSCWYWRKHSTYCIRQTTRGYVRMGMGCIPIIYESLMQTSIFFILGHIFVRETPLLPFPISVIITSKWACISNSQRFNQGLKDYPVFPPVLPYTVVIKPSAL